MGLNLLQLQNGSKGYGSQVLFHEASFSIDENEHVGVIGINGAGKSTLFRVLIKEEELDEGQVIRSKNLSVGYLSQHDHWAEGETGNQYLERITKIPIWELKSQAHDLQISEEVYEKPILSLSGGYRMRIKIVALLAQLPNLMLLDEPTNYLDLETTLLLEKFLQNYEGAFLLISHDREFLRRTTDHILEIESGEMTKYNGTIDDYFEQKELLRQQLQAQAATQQLKRKMILEFVSRFGAKATKARQAQSKLRSLQKMEQIEIKPLPTSAVIRIPDPTHVGKSVLKLEQCQFGYGERKILRDVNVEIQRGDHIAVVGLNGAGKSTLLKGIAGTLTPLQGDRQVGFQVKVGIFNQHVIEVLDPKLTVLESLQTKAHVDVTRQQILDMAGSLLFSGEQIHKKVSVLSGGEKSRVALGQILLQKVPCLLLDEPTNHLDFQTVEALTQALNAFPGTFVVVSHDRGFVRRISSKILEISNQQVLLYPGSYDDYVWSLQQRLHELENAESHEDLQKPKAAKPLVKASPSKDQAKKLKQVRIGLQECEDKLALLDQENKKLNQQITEAPTNLAELIQKLTENTLQVQQLENHWMMLSEELQTLSADL